MQSQRMGRLTSKLLRLGMELLLYFVAIRDISAGREGCMNKELEEVKENFKRLLRVGRRKKRIEISLAPEGS